VFGWLALVALSVLISMNVSTTEIEQSDAAVGESAEAARITDDAGFNKDRSGEESNELMELVLLQSDKRPKRPVSSHNRRPPMLKPRASATRLRASSSGAIGWTFCAPPAGKQIDEREAEERGFRNDQVGR